MPRLARIVVPGLPHHRTQRDNRREAIFFEEGDHEVYRDLLAEQAQGGRRQFMISEPIHRSAKHKRYIGTLFATTLGVAISMIGTSVVLWHSSDAQSSGRTAVVLFGLAGFVNYLATVANIMRLKKLYGQQPATQTTEKTASLG